MEKFIEYPKWIEHPTDKDERGWPKRVLVKDQEAEEKVTGKKPKNEKKPETSW